MYYRAKTGYIMNKPSRVVNGQTIEFELITDPLHNFIIDEAIKLRCQPIYSTDGDLVVVLLSELVDTEFMSIQFSKENIKIIYFSHAGPRDIVEYYNFSSLLQLIEMVKEK